MQDVARLCISACVLRPSCCPRSMRSIRQSRNSWQAPGLQTRIVSHPVACFSSAREEKLAEGVAGKHGQLAVSTLLLATNPSRMIAGAGAICKPGTRNHMSLHSLLRRYRQVY